LFRCSWNGRGPALPAACLLAAFIFPLAVNAEAIQLTQADGSIVELESPARTVVTLSPHLAELAFAAGAGDRLVATVEYSGYPEAALGIPRVGDAFRVDVERIVALHPDLVIAWDSGNPRLAVEQIRSLGLAVWSVEIRELDEIPETLEAMGQATGEQAIARRAAASFREREASLAERFRGVGQISYFYQVAEKPLFTINGEHLISKGLKLCNARNIFEDEAGLAFQVAHESVIVANPNALLAPWLEGEGDPLEGWRAWPRMTAVANDALYLLNADKISRATPRILDSLETACEKLHGREQSGGS
jgi:iron complex transport system substrate-binding protein